jgi:Cutinase
MSRLWRNRTRRLTWLTAGVAAAGMMLLTVPATSALASARPAHSPLHPRQASAARTAEVTFSVVRKLTTPMKGCPNVFFIGARGSGQSAGGPFEGLGPEVDKMFSVARAYLSDISTKTYALNYPAESVSVLKPSAYELMLGVMGIAYYFAHNVRKFLASISKGTSATYSLAIRLHRLCNRAALVFGGYSQGAMVAHQASVKLKGKLTGIDLLLGDGNRVANTEEATTGTAPAKAEGIESYFYMVPGHLVGTKPVDITFWNALDICNNHDIVCDFNWTNLTHFSSSAKVHTSYAVEKNGHWIYEKVLTEAGNWAGCEIDNFFSPGHHGRCYPTAAG